MIVFLATSEGLIDIGELNLFAQDEALQKSSDEKKTEESASSTLKNLLDLPIFNADKANKDDIEEYLSVIERKQEQINERIEILKIREEQLKQLEEY